METSSALLVTGEFPSQRPVTRSFDVFFDLRLNTRLRHRLFETPSRVHYDVTVMITCLVHITCDSNITLSLSWSSFYNVHPSAEGLHIPSCRHDRETLSVSLDLCGENPPVTGGKDQRCEALMLSMSLAWVKMPNITPDGVTNHRNILFHRSICSSLRR